MRERTLDAVARGSIVVYEECQEEDQVLDDEDMRVGTVCAVPRILRFTIHPDDCPPPAA